jgi:glycosyltransferase involved in cell wall biosynthesis
MYYPHHHFDGSSFFCFANRPDWGLIAGSDIIVVQRCCTRPQFDFINTCQQLGQKVIYDLDDNVWDLPEYNPAHQQLMAMREGFNACIQLVDLVTVSTKQLAKEVRKHVKKLVNYKTHKEIPIIVCENRIDARLYAPPMKRPELTIGWSGSSSHVGDLPLVMPALHEALKADPQVQIEFRGCEPTEDLKKLPNFRHKLWTAVAEFSARMPVWGWHIALAPLTDHNFNNSKSAIKMVEAAYCGIPCLTSWVKPYDDFTSWDSELRWLLCAGPSAWEKKLVDLVCDPARRDYLGQRMHKVMLEHYSFSKPHEGWREAFDTARAL